MGTVAGPHGGDPPRDPSLSATFSLPGDQLRPLIQPPKIGPRAREEFEQRKAIAKPPPSGPGMKLLLNCYPGLRSTKNLS